MSWAVRPSSRSAPSRAKCTAAAGTFDINLPLTGAPGIECRTSQPSGQYQVVVTFANPVAVSGGATLDAPGGGSISGITVNGNVVTVDLANVGNAQIITINSERHRRHQHAALVAIPMGVLIGDTTANGQVNSSDIGETKDISGQPTNAGNFRTDVTVNGVINSSDVGVIKSVLRHAVPGPSVRPGDYSLGESRFTPFTPHAAPQTLPRARRPLSARRRLWKAGDPEQSRALQQASLGNQRL